MFIIELLKSIVLGIVEGITEWLPISSTGHMILVNEFLNNKDGFTASDLYLYVIQLGAILAVATIYFNRLNPFAPSKSEKEKKATWEMWFKVLVACLPAAIIGLLLDSFMEHFENWMVVSAMLIVYGAAFIVVESINKKTSIHNMKEMDYKTALLIGAFQVLSIIPGTSRSGATILGAMILGCSRGVAAEFSFFLAIPVMFGVSILKTAKVAFECIFEGAPVPGMEDVIVLLAGMAVAYAVSMLAIRFLMNFVEKHDFKYFGIYRIVLGLVVILYFTLI